jgi:hypothetical protein
VVDGNFIHHTDNQQYKVPEGNQPLFFLLFLGHTKPLRFLSVFKNIHLSSFISNLVEWKPREFEFSRPQHIDFFFNLKTGYKNLNF